MIAKKNYQAIIIGGGPAGLASSYYLKKKNIHHIILEKGGVVGYNWTLLYDKLKLNTGKHFSSLPGMPFPRKIPLFPSKHQFIEYLKSNRQKNELPRKYNTVVISIERTENLWVVKTKEKSFYTKNLILATGIIGNPYIPTIPELNQYQGKVIHSTQFKNWKEYRNKKVLIVGCGNTASDIASELAQNNIKVDVSIRDGNYVFPLTLLKIPIQYYVILLDKCPKVILLFLANIISKIFIILSKLKIKSKQEHFTKNIIPKPSVGILDKTPMIGTEFSYLVNRGKINIQKVIIASSKEEITFTDGTSHKYDQIILATGYRPDISYAKEYLDCHEFGFLRKDYVRSPSHDSLFFIGFNYSLTGALQNLKRDSRLVSDFILSRY